MIPPIEAPFLELFTKLSITAATIASLFFTLIWVMRNNRTTRSKEFDTYMSIIDKQIRENKKSQLDTLEEMKSQRMACDENARYERDQHAKERKELSEHQEKMNDRAVTAIEELTKAIQGMK